MSPSPAPDPPPPPIGLFQETPLQAIIQQTRYLLQYLKEAASSKNPTQSLNFDQIFHVLSNQSQIRTPNPGQDTRAVRSDRTAIGDSGPSATGNLGCSCPR
ncbi:hypothetical protein PtB15_17B92 [Puccinia triticina]|nr:hypothetical protein PtB15_17B92 [Puccinia triticina]